jgi:hypothetical protein
MPRFVQAHGNKHLGYPLLNLDHVARVREKKEEGKIPAYECFDREGHSLGTISQYEVDLADAPSGIVAETSGTVLIAVWDDFEERFPILAWSIASGTATPVICESLPEHYVLEMRLTGEAPRWVIPEHSSFDDMAKAIASARDDRIKIRTRSTPALLSKAGETPDKS